MELMTEPVVYAALNGEELKDLVLLRVRQRLAEDNAMFKRSLVYHRVAFEVPLRFTCFGQPSTDVLIGQGEMEARTLQQENRHLSDKLERIKKEWDMQVARLAGEYAAKEQPLRQELDFARARLQELEAELRGKFETVRPSPPLVRPDGGTTFEIVIEQPPIEEPDRIRAELEAADETVGKSPAEVASTDTDGHPVRPPEAANRGAVVGGGQRPANVVGKPR